MADLITGLTDYPTSVDTQTDVANETDDIIAEHINGPNKAIVAIETALGTEIAGVCASLAARLGITLMDDGAILYGTSFPVSPSNLPHFFYDTASDTMYVRNPNTATYDAVSTATVLADYMRKSSADTVTAQHTFNPSAVAPFIIGAAVDETVTVADLNADMVDGKHAGNASGDVALANTTVCTDLNADQVDGQHRVLTINADHTHATTGAEGGTVSHTVLTDKGTNTHAQLDTFVASKAAASGIASLNSDTRLVQPALTLYDGSGNRAASQTPGAYVIPVGDVDGRIAFTAKPKWKGCAVQMSSAFSILTSLGYIAWDGTDVYDPDGMHSPSTNNTRITLPSGTGRLVRFSLQIQATYAVGGGTIYAYVVTSTNEYGARNTFAPATSMKTYIGGSGDYSGYCSGIYDFTGMTGVYFEVGAIAAPGTIVTIPNHTHFIVEILD